MNQSCDSFDDDLADDSQEEEEEEEESYEIIGNCIALYKFDGLSMNTNMYICDCKSIMYLVN